MRILDNSSFRKPASSQTIAEVETKLGLHLPNDYRAFLASTDGYEGTVAGSGFVMFCSTEELSQFREMYQVEQYVPGLMIGSNGGGEAYGFDTRSSPWTVKMIPFIPMDWNESVLVGRSFEDFLNSLKISS
jgi:hypothetical protein